MQMVSQHTEWLVKEEYREIFTSVMNGTDADRAAINRGAANNNWDMDDYSSG